MFRRKYGPTSILRRIPKKRGEERKRCVGTTHPKTAIDQGQADGHPLREDMPSRSDRPPPHQGRSRRTRAGRNHECFEWVPQHMASSTPVQSSSPIARWSKKTVTASLRPLCLLLRALCRSCERAPWQSQTRLALKDRNGQNHAPFLTWPQVLALQLPAQPRMPARLKASESAMGQPAPWAHHSNGSAEPQLAAATDTSSRGSGAPKADDIAIAST